MGVLAIDIMAFRCLRLETRNHLLVICCGFPDPFHSHHCSLYLCPLAIPAQDAALIMVKLTVQCNTDAECYMVRS